jgi:hypothetical protein
MASNHDFYYFERKLDELEKSSLNLIKDTKSYVYNVDKFIIKARLVYQGMNVYIYNIENISCNKVDFLHDFNYNINTYLNIIDRGYIDYKKIKNLKGQQIANFLNYIFSLLYDTLEDLEESCFKGGLI